MNNEKNISKKDACKLICYGATLDSEKLLKIGYCFYLGIATKQDYTEAYKYYGMSALMGNAEAQYRLGICYQWGYGEPQDAERAFYWYDKSSEQNYLPARIRLAHLYFEGEGCARDQEEGFNLLRSAAEAGCEDAFMELAGKYYDGSPVRAPDRKKAQFWIRKALEPGYDEAEDALKLWDWSE
jgi:TPR repeat protein